MPAHLGRNTSDTMERNRSQLRPMPVKRRDGGLPFGRSWSSSLRVYGSILDQWVKHLDFSNSKSYALCMLLPGGD